MRRFLTKKNLIIVTVLLAGLGVWWWRGRQLRMKNEELRIVEVIRKDIVETLTVSGEVKAQKLAKLNFLSAGRLAFLKVQEGSDVEMGETLMGLDTGDLKAAQTRAWYAYLAADANAKAVEDSVKGHDSDETFSQKNSRVAAQTARDAAYETWLTARRAVDFAVLRTPLTGIVTSVTVQSVGDIVGIADGATVVDLQSLYFEVEVDESDLGKLTVDQKVDVSLDAYKGEKFSGVIEKIAFVSRTSSTGANVYPVIVKIAEEEAKSLMRLGMNGDADIVLGRVENVLGLPIEAVVDGEVEMTSGEKKKVETGLESFTDVEIKSGLKEGEKVVVR